MSGLSEEHAQARIGCVGASRVHDIIRTLANGKPAQSREDYLVEKIIERRTGLPCEDGFITKEMQYGIDNESLARATYALTVVHEVVNIQQFIKHPRIPWAGCSPDAFVGKEGLAEFKVPKSATHYRLLTGRDKLKPEYLTQVLWQLACCVERIWCDFVSFDPRQPPNDQLFVLRIWRQEYLDRIAQLEDAVRKFNEEVEREINKRVAA